MVIKTDTPYSLTKLTGLSLCCRQKQLVLDKKPTAGPLSAAGTGDLAVIINRYIPYVDREEPDSDNLNVTFLTAYDRRVKVIYVKVAHQEPPKSYNCVFHIAPMFAAEAAGLF